MSKADSSIDPRILASAKEEFLTHGFEKASLKTICANANVTTGALYKRYKGKEDLFHALVEQAMKELQEAADSRRLEELSGISDEELKQAWDMNEEGMLWWFRFFYERYDAFVLLLRCSEGSGFSNFHHDWVEKMTAYTYEYYMEARRRRLTLVDLSREELHTLLSAFWAVIYEPFIHSFTWEQMMEHCRLVCRFFDWYAVLRF